MERIKQTATATSQFVFNLTSGTTENGYKTATEGLRIPTFAQQSNWSMFDVPMLVEVTSGVENGKWMICTGTLERDNSNVLTFTTSSDEVLMTSDTNSYLTYDLLTISAADTVNMTIVPIGAGSLALDVIARRGGIGNRPLRYRNSTLAAGRGARAGEIGNADTDSAIAMGTNSIASKKGAVGVGLRANATSPFSAGIGGYRSSPYHWFQLALGGMNNVYMLRSSAENPITWTMRQHGQLIGATTDATAFDLKCYDPTTGDNDNDSTAYSGSENIFCDSGLTVFEATLVATNVANRDTKQWRLRWSVKTSADYSTTAMFQTLEKTVVAADAGAAAWDVAVSADSANNATKVTVTGAAATNIVWQLIYDADNASVY